MKNNETRERMERWRVQSPDTPGFHNVVTPETCECREARIYRLNLPGGGSHTLDSCGLELSAALIHGSASIKGAGLDHRMEKFDSFFIPGDSSVTVLASEDCIFYIAGAVCEGYGKPSFRKFDITLPIGDVHQIHGSGAGRREVMFTLAPQDPASRLICGLTWGGEGAWTSWPPHQHENDLEEVYCYFDMPAPKFGLHISYLRSGETDEMTTHVVHSGTMVQAPCGYHPTVASPGTQNAYMWALAAFSHAGRRYDLAREDPVFGK